MGTRVKKVFAEAIKTEISQRKSSVINLSGKTAMVTMRDCCDTPGLKPGLSMERSYWAGES